MWFMTNTKQCDYIFFRPIGKGGTEASNHERQAFASNQSPTEAIKDSCADVHEPSLVGGAVEEQKQTSTIGKMIHGVQL